MPTSTFAKPLGCQSDDENSQAGSASGCMPPAARTPQRSRRSLSDWYSATGSPECDDRDDQSAPSAPLSPSTSTCPSTRRFEDDDLTASLLSPRKRRHLPREGTRSEWPGRSTFFIGDDLDAATAAESSAAKVSSAAHVVDSETKTLVRGLCAEYFENNVSLIVRCMQQAQDGLHQRVQELSAAMDRKADLECVTPFKDIEELVTRETTSRTEKNSVATLVRMQEMEAKIRKKADAVNAPTLQHLKSLSAQVDQKVTMLEQKFQSMLDMKADISGVQGLTNERSYPSMDQFSELRDELREKVESKDLLRQRDICELQSRLQDLRSHASPASESTEKVAEVKKVQVLVAAAGVRFDRQLKELRTQLQSLKDEVNGPGSPGSRWPGRVIDTASVKSAQLSDDGSDCGSIGGSSIVGSAVGSAIGPEEKAEIRKIQTVVAAAGTAFSRDMRDVRKQLRDLRDDVNGVKETVLGKHCSDFSNCSPQHCT